MIDLYLKFHLATDALIILGLFMTATAWAIDNGVSKLGYILLERKTYHKIVHEILSERFN